MWASMNIGASSITDDGLYFAWGETTGYTVNQLGTDKEFNTNNYRFFNGEEYTKYNSFDNKNILDSDDDAAHVIMGGKWMMPKDFVMLQEPMIVQVINSSLLKAVFCH
jgi:hypothetical protein